MIEPSDVPDDLISKIERLRDWCRRAQIAAEWQIMPQMVAAQIGNELDAILNGVNE